jgi:hypothetical protein
MKRRLFFSAMLLLCAQNVTAQAVDYPIGEKLTYRIMWGLFPVGHTVIQCDEMSLNGTDVIRIRVEAKSNSLVSTLYPVNDRIDSFISRETGLPFRIEKRTSEGDCICDDVLQLNHSEGIATWESQSASISTNYLIHSDTLDVAAFLYAIRTASFAIGKAEQFHIAVDGALHGLTIVPEQKKMMQTGLSDKKIPCTRYSVVPDRDDLFVRKIPSDMWVADSSRRVLIRMKAKTPVGSVRIVLDRVETSDEIKISEGSAGNKDDSI